MRIAAILLAASLALLASATAASAAPGSSLELVSEAEVNPRLLQLEFTTPAMAEGEAAARVLLPPGYEGSGRDYPVLYLLHGAGYDEKGWTEEGDVEAIVGDRKLIVVMPNGGGNGYYTDWYNAGAGGPPAYEQFHVRELIPFIDERFRTRDERGGRALAGFSMGGFGAMSYAARHSDMFSGAFSFSGAIDTNYGPFQAIGEASSLADTGQYAAIWGQRQAEEVRWRARNPWDLAPNLRGMTLEMRTGNGMGGGDFGGPAFDPIEFGVHEMADSMDARLNDLAIPHLLEDYGPGAHEFPYYSRDLRNSLPAIMSTFRDPPQAPRRFTHLAVEPSYSVFGYDVRFKRPQLEFSRLDGTLRGHRFTLSGSGLARVRTPSLKPRQRYEVTVDGDVAEIDRTLRADRKGRLSLRVPLGTPNPFQQYSPAAAGGGGTIVRHATVRIRRVEGGKTGREAGARADRAAPWVPSPDDRWQYQLEGGEKSLAASGGIDVDICKAPFTGGACVRPDVFDIDLYEDGQVAGKEGVPNSAAVDAIHARGAHAVCYLSAGTAEKFRPDYAKYVRFDEKHGGRLLGKPFSDRFSNENWLDIGDPGNRGFVLDRMKARTKLCAKAGFDAVEYDVVDAYAQGRRVTGFKIRAKAQLTYDRALAKLAHRSGLSVALKNDLGQLEALEPAFDFAINEQCLQYNECTNNPPPGYRTFLDAGKAVFQVEYRQEPDEFCADANALGLSSIGKARDFSLRAEPWESCG